MWKCNGCSWIGDDLVPIFIPAGIQGNVKTFACPVCGKIVGDGVILQDPEPGSPSGIDTNIDGEGEIGESSPDENIPEEVATETETETGAEYECRYCHKECKSAAGLTSHEKACSDNPENI